MSFFTVFIYCLATCKSTLILYDKSALIDVKIKVFWDSRIVLLIELKVYKWSLYSYMILIGLNGGLRALLS